MSTNSGGRDEVEPVTLDELVQLMAEELPPDEEARLRMRMERDPNAEVLLERLRSVDSYFRPAGRGDPAPVPEDMPADVAARLDAHLAELSRRHAEGLPIETTEPDADQA